MTKAHVAPVKKKVVDEFAKLLVEYPIVAAVNMERMPTAQLSVMRSSLRGKAVIKMTKRRLLKLAIAKAKTKRPGIELIEPHLLGMPALLFTKENPFKLYNFLKKNKSQAPAKAGNVLPKDVLVQAGPTSFTPGPIISELGSFGIKSGVENGKIVIKEDRIIAKKGEVVSDKLASMLIRLAIEPMEIGLDLVAAFENGIIFGKDVMDIDGQKFVEDITLAAQWAFNLSVEAGYANKDNIEFMLIKARRESLALARAQDILTDATVGDVLAKAQAQMASLAQTISYAPGSQ
ncbi:50S ribosomal protein L10 [Candidatus Woesearchaeota archaeon]|nr:50S ribosomal protein L10 [Candidatus Woesearchaeota archaeon]